MTHRAVGSFLRSCKQHGVVPTRYLFWINIEKQQALLFERDPQGSQSDFGESGDHGGLSFTWTSKPHYVPCKLFRCSTSRYGIGEKAGSNMTPRGLHRIARKVGGGWPAGAVFKSREFVGYTWQGMPEALITTRIMWLEGLEPGFNRGGDRDSYSRYIYIHGTGNALTLGRPASHGCTHLADQDLVPLYSKLPCGTLVWITER